MPTFAIVFIVVIISISVFFAYMAHKRKKEADSNIDMEAERRNASSYKMEMENGSFSYLNKWMKGAPLDAFTSAGVPITTGDKAKNFAKDAAKSVALGAIGVRARYQRVETPSFLVLSGSDVHFLSANTDGDLDEHVVFDAFRLKEATIQNKGLKKSSAGEQNVYEISFNIDGKNVVVEAYDRLTSVAGLSTFAGMISGAYFKKQAESRAVGEMFINKLGEKYPNLKTTINN